LSAETSRGRCACVRLCLVNTCLLQAQLTRGLLLVWLRVSIWQGVQHRHPDHRRVLCKVEGASVPQLQGNDGDYCNGAVSCVTFVHRALCATLSRCLSTSQEAFRLFLGVTAATDAWNSENSCCVVKFAENPLTGALRSRLLRAGCCCCCC
jgi:hypothetical protein